MNVCAVGAEGSLLGIVAFHGELAEAIKEGIVCCPLPLSAGLKVATQPNLFGENKELVFVNGMVFLLIRGGKESY